ncbi:hypothetical protein N7448_009330 [Penicillium atrosanguineum]|uniref:Uncharacterized protein n=1 Tax=Penicillium atrosanguineum TaxID=1132637 RepID=A0A9W9PZZ9_9EURO|nr:uncharacterized protein N7443_006580 [Penicillium atrosanguineum]KAJ5123233.1 hypothetical protein N7448_009330 [Penicillium atrosanguineum]KAJ5298460.1 hypothetical protein N7443_006580 [Penicillium atrosanguineum]KAJ5321274.1 hypothetical protein N7476_004276 [Penicillium atrosanguineum]
MECFRQIYRCIKSPFIRKSEQGRILHISSPTDFRKEELPACFSDAESVLSPKQNPVELSVLTPSQHPDVPEEPRSSEGRDEHRDDALPAVSQGEDPEPSPENEHQTVPVRFRDRLRPSRWLSPVRSSTPASSHERQASSNELEMYTTAEEKPKEI